MAAVVKRIAMITPIVLFLGLSAVFAIRGMPGKWHDRCEQFWKEQKWEEVKSLASNLLRLDEADPEVLFLAMLASEQQKDTNAVRVFGTSLLEMRALNLRWEKSVASLLVPKSLLERLSLYKTRAVVAILLSITALCLVAILRRPGLSLIFSTALSVVGIVLLLL